jgi:hypothetical protein
VKRALAFGAVAVVTVLALAGCEPTNAIPTPSPSDIAGTWTHGNADIHFDADGDFTMTDVPLGVIEQDPANAAGGPTGQPVASVSGTWTIGSGGTDVGGAPGVQLSFVKPEKVGFDYGLTLVVSHDYPANLYVFLGRPDSNVRYTFTRVK